ncbi:MAG: class I SAM-dependent methyltransferase [Candidatus Paceibacterota bacterium]|jgi:hypothetical protein
MKTEIEKEYGEQEYVRHTAPYKAYLQALEAVFDWTIVDSFIDLGCNNGCLIEVLHRKYPHIDILGLDYFEWAKKHADESIRENIKKADLGLPYSFGKQYSIVNCSEVGEHLPPKVEDVLIENITKASKDIIILTWSNVKINSTSNNQHVNPHSRKYVISKLKLKGFGYWEEATDKIINILRLSLDGIGHMWWADNIMVFKKIVFFPIKSRYFIQGINTNNESHKKDLSPNRFSSYGSKTLQFELKELTDKIRYCVANRIKLSILRASDGDYFFLKKIPIGSASPGRRALTIAYEDINIDLFRSSFWHNDVITFNLGPGTITSWRSFIMTELPVKILGKIFKRGFHLLNNKKIRYGLNLISRYLTFLNILPIISVWLYSFKRGYDYFRKAFRLTLGDTPSCESVYALVTTKWLFNNFKDEIGIIAGDEKLELIKELASRKAYCEYIGIESFCDYIPVPQKGAANNVEALAKSMSEKVSKSKAKIFLVGAGSSKVALIPLLQTYSDAVFIDVGAGIDALAGIVCQDRPYFADWINYRIKDRDYSKIDFMDKGNPAWNNPVYKVVTIS